MTYKNYRFEKGYELVEETHYPDCSTFVIGDLHLNHTNIIKYCNRPFDNVADMNRVLVKNWNLVVKKTDTVFFLGDMAMGNSDKLINSLNGNIFFIRGNHDKSRDQDSMHDQLYLNYKGIKFQFVHNPNSLQGKFDGWTIHGHHHNNYPDNFSFFDPTNRKFNVSVEMIKYQPFPMTKIVELIQSDKGKIITL